MRQAGMCYTEVAHKQQLMNHRFRHAVTNAKSRTPSSEVGGGILADEMGMGKSLSILALITKTIESSEQWGRGESSDADDRSTLPQKPVRGTLVLVPSAGL